MKDTKIANAILIVGFWIAAGLYAIAFATNESLDGYMVVSSLLAGIALVASIALGKRG